MAANRKDDLFSLCYLLLQHYHRYVRKDWSLKCGHIIKL